MRHSALICHMESILQSTIVIISLSILQSSTLPIPKEVWNLADCSQNTLLKVSSLFFSLEISERKYYI